ncbi:MAG: HAD family hydrolase [Candidatus Aminicenantes bacterium]|nr:HAD family hydrolase [Candidatus Aminicenantes bacterium]
MIEAVFFDCWDTLLADDSSREMRQRDHLQAVLQEYGSPLTDAEMAVLFREEFKLFEEHIIAFRKTPDAMKRTENLLELAQISLPLSEVVALADFNDRIALDCRPPVVPGIKEVLPELAMRYRMAVICNTGWHSGETVRNLLDGYGLSDAFFWLSFSDEVGVAKPHKQIFDVTLEKLRCRPENAVHVGDSEYTDVAGAKAANISALLFTGINSKYKEKNSADFVFDDYKDLETILSKLG